MSKKANLLTIRKSQNHFKILDANPKTVIKHIRLMQVFIFLLQKKGVWIFHTKVVLDGLNGKFLFWAYFTGALSRKSQKKKKRLKLLQKTLKNSIKTKLVETKVQSPFFLMRTQSCKTLKKPIIKSSLVFSALINLFFKISSYTISLVYLNMQVLRRNSKYFKRRTYRFRRSLFRRRFSLFLDSVRVFSLILQKKLGAAAFLFILSLILQFLTKKLHARFLVYVRHLIYGLVKNSKDGGADYRSVGSLGQLKGIKFKISGKLKGKLRASSYLIQYGFMPNQSIDQLIDYSLIHTYTRYGAFGMRAWFFK